MEAIRINQPSEDDLKSGNIFDLEYDVSEIVDKSTIRFYSTNKEIASVTAEGEHPEAIREDSYDSCFVGTAGENTAAMTIRWEEEQCIGNIVLKENICMGQRVEQFVIEAEKEGAFAEVYKGTVIGYKRIVPLERLVTKCIRIRILDSRTEPTLAFVGVYKSMK